MRKKFTRIFVRESWETKRRLLVHNIDLCDLSSSLIRDYTKWPSDKFRDYDDEFSQRLRQSHIRPIFDVDFFFQKKYTHIKTYSSRQSEFTWHFCGRRHILTFKWDDTSITSKSYCDKVALHYRNDDDKKNQDCGPHHERQNETLSCVQVIKV